MKKLPRGFQNNNPLNLRVSNNNWLGKVKNNTDGVFEQFTTIEYGLRAAMRNIATIVNRRKNQGLSTNVRGLVHIWAPNGDGGNNELAYCSAIYKHSGIEADNLVKINDREFMCRLIQSMCVVENGRAVSQAQVDSAYNLAFGRINAVGSLQSKAANDQDKREISH